MTLSKYKLSLLAAAGAECEYKAEVCKIDAITYDGKMLITIPNGFKHGRFKEVAKESITPIMRSIDQMNEAEKEAFKKEFGDYPETMSWDEYNMPLTAIAFNGFNIITWLLDRGIWYDDDDFKSGNIKQKEIKV